MQSPCPYRFYKKAGFFDNRCTNGHGGGIANDGGELK